MNRSLALQGLRGGEVCSVDMDKCGRGYDADMTVPLPNRAVSLPHFIHTTFHTLSHLDPLPIELVLVGHCGNL